MHGQHLFYRFVCYSKTIPEANNKKIVKNSYEYKSQHAQFNGVAKTITWHVHIQHLVRRNGIREYQVKQTTKKMGEALMFLFLENFIWLVCLDYDNKLIRSKVASLFDKCHLEFVENYLVNAKPSIIAYPIKYQCSGCNTRSSFISTENLFSQFHFRENV